MVRERMTPRERTLEELIAWIGDCLERLERHADDEERVRGTLRALKHACRPDSNPRLRAALETTARPVRPPEAETRDTEPSPADEARARVRAALRDGWERQRRRRG